MHALTSTSESTLCDGSTVPGIMIIYEDRVTGFQAKRFCDILSDSIARRAQAPPACWRSELLDLPGIATEMTADAARSEFVILSLRGDRGLSVELKQWIEGWLVLASGGSSSLIALFDRERSTASSAESVRRYLRQISSEAEIPFFAHCALRPLGAANERLAGEDENEFVARAHRRRRGFLKTERAAIDAHKTCLHTTQAAA